MNSEDLAEGTAVIAQEFRNTEMTHGQANELTFEVVRNALSGAHFTISEFEELAEIIAEKKMEIQWREDHTCPPLPLIPLETIFSYLSTRPVCGSSKKDLRSCRLVCHDWWLMATLELQKRVPFPVPSYKYLHVPPIDDLPKFLEIMKTSQLFPVNSFHLTLDSLTNLEHSNVVKDFFQLIGPVLKHLSLDFTQFSGVKERKSNDVRTNLEEIQLKKLQILGVRFGIVRSPDVCPAFLDEDTRTAFLSDYFASAPNLQKLILESDYNSAELVRSLQNSPLPHLTTLVLTSRTLYNKELVNLGHVVSLKHLSLHITDMSRLKSSTMKEFFQSQSKTLEYLKLHIRNEFLIRSPYEYEFPRMKSLKIFSIIGDKSVYPTLRFARMDWNQCFPKLEELKMRELEEHWLESLFPLDYSGSPHIGLNTIDFPPGFDSRLSNNLPVIGRIFPNVHTVKINFENLFNPNFSDFHPNLKKIVIRIVKMFPSNVTDVKTFLKDYAWKLPLDSGVRKLFEGLTEFAFEFGVRQGYVGMEPETHDCSWFLSLLRERFKSQVPGGNSLDSDDGSGIGLPDELKIDCSPMQSELNN